MLCSSEQKQQQNRIDTVIEYVYDFTDQKEKLGRQVTKVNVAISRIAPLSLSHSTRQPQSHPGAESLTKLITF